MKNKEAIEWLGLLKQRDIEFDDYSEDTKELREKAIGCFQEALNLGIKALENQKTGHWVLKRVSPTKLYEENIKEYECSECYRGIRCTESQLIDYPYCHCGAKMKGE